MESIQETVVQNEILAIRREMTHISMIDEFAKHARLQRQLNKLQEELKHRGTFLFKIGAIYFQIRVSSCSVKLFISFLFSKCKNVFQCETECCNYIFSTDINGMYQKEIVLLLFSLTVIAEFYSEI
jgi:hypothetical protein